MTKWMSMREFLRGGYKTLDETTVVSNHGRPVFTVFPYSDQPQHNGPVDVKSLSIGPIDRERKNVG